MAGLGRPAAQAFVLGVVVVGAEPLGMAGEIAGASASSLGGPTDTDLYKANTCTHEKAQHVNTDDGSR